MIKKTILIIFLSILVLSCGKKGDPEYIDPEKKAELKEILIKYRDEKTVLKKGVREETSKINFLIRHKISLNSLMRLKSHQIYKLMKELALTRKPSTVNKYVNIKQYNLVNLYSDPGRIRTPNPQSRNLIFYPVELLSQYFNLNYF